MRTTMAAALASGAFILGSAAAAGATSVPVDVKITNIVVIEVAGADFTQLAVPLKVTCDPSVGAVSFNVFIAQGSVGGYAFVPPMTCTGKTVNVVAHPQSNFGTLFTAGTARVTVNEFTRGDYFQQYVTIK